MTDLFDRCAATIYLGYLYIPIISRVPPLSSSTAITEITTPPAVPPKTYFNMQLTYLIALLPFTALTVAAPVPQDYGE
jgi:hypothetical protein